MAKKEKRERQNLVSVCAFWGLVIASLLYVTYGIFNLFGIFSEFLGIIDLVGKIALCIAIAVAAYSFTKGKKKGWKILYWIALLIYVLGITFGYVHFNF